MMNQTLQQPRRPRIACAGLFLLAAMLPGCASITNLIEARSTPVAGPQNPVRDFACIWQQGEGRDQRGMPCRGFCGQLLFQTTSDKKPAIVNGTVTIYVFDNVGTPEEQVKPFEVFEFTAQEWATFGRRTNLGMTYQLFIPYTRTGGREAECSICVKYTPTGTNTPLYSHPENVSLRGASASATGAMADAIDRKLTHGSPLFTQSPLVKPRNTEAAYAEMLKKMQADSKPKPVAAITPPSGRQSPTNKVPEIQRLQAILDDSSRAVDHADYSEPASSRKSVQPAEYTTDHETL
jgi:hypothetical protein